MTWNKPMPAQPVVAVAGATGVVGREMLKVLEQRNFPAAKVKALASARSAGSTVPFNDGELVVEEMTPASLRGRRHRAVRLRRLTRVQGVCVEAVVDAGCRHDRQLQRIPHGRGRAAGGARGERPGSSSLALPASSPTRTAPPSRWSLRSSRFTTSPVASNASSCPPTRLLPVPALTAMAELYDQTRALPGRHCPRTS